MYARALVLTLLALLSGCSGGSDGSPDPITTNANIPTAGVELWLRADLDVVLDTSPQVVLWVDQSGNGRHATMGPAARQPMRVDGALNGKPVIRFSGAQSLNLIVAAQPTAFSVFVVGKNSNPFGSFAIILGPSGNSPNNQLRWEDGTQVLFVGTGNGLPIVTSTIGDTRVYHALSARYDGSAMTVYRDGHATSSSSFETLGPWTLASIGSFYSQNFMFGDLAEVIIYRRALSEPERESVNTYLRSKYALP